ncbi:argininosuccinate lyase [Terrabacter sp. GCM10028922]|uniref:argininosuccinate lyase n=1 Tax=Terrabacter sp. GCM10028922 TaxID=3273428 RepID=UPI003612149E
MTRHLPDPASGRRVGGPQTSAAPELIASGFALENEDAPILHRGYNLADMAHVLDLAQRRIIPEHAQRALLKLLLEAHETDAEDFPYDAAFGEPYNSRERFFVDRIGDTAGWLHAGRPRREAARIALRLHLRTQIAHLVREASRFVEETARLSRRHVHTLMADQTYLQKAQPSTFGHYLLSFAQPALRDAHRLLAELAEINASPGGAGCVNGTRLQQDRTALARTLGFDTVIGHTRDAMWRVDDLIAVLAIGTSMVSNQSKLAEDLEIYSSSEFNFVDLHDSYSRSSVLMPQKRNPYALSIVRGASGVLIGRLTGFLAVTKSPSARSDNFIFAYGEVPRALDLTIRVTALMTGVVRTLHVNADNLREELVKGYTQATDLAEHLTQIRHVDYRTAYFVVGDVVRDASRVGLRGLDLTADMLNTAAEGRTGASWGLIDSDLQAVLDPAQIVASRQAVGGAAPEAVERMLETTFADATALAADAAARLSGFAAAELDLLARATAAVNAGVDPAPAHPAPKRGGSL